MNFITGSRQFIGPGRRVEAVGFPVMGEYAPILQDGFLRDLGPANPIEPVRIRARDVIAEHQEFDNVPYDEQLVQLEGTVTEGHIQRGKRIWILRQGNQVFEASLPLSVDAENVRGTGIGSVLLLTGICAVYADFDHVPISFGILLRSAQDIRVIERASWWSTNHSLMVLACVAGTLGLMVLWAVILRKRVEQQTRIIRASEGRFRELAQHDVLTGLPNRLMLEEHISQALTRCKEENLRAVLLTIDVDRFKHINDTYGHLVGDACLKIVATRLLSLVRRVDTIARTGGEEFMVVVGGLASLENASRISTAILDLFLDPVQTSGHEIKLTVSIGGAVYPENGTDAETLRRRSDQALYEAKRMGRNRALFASEELCASVELGVSLEISIRQALDNQQFQLYYQPIFDGRQQIRRFEALLRTTKPELAVLGPAKFIPIAETSGLIMPLGRWVVEEACRQIAEWQSQGTFDCPVAVNISARQLGGKGFAEEILSILERRNINPRMLELELTETTVMTELTVVEETVRLLADAGIAIAIDDFGTGYSSLSRLRNLPIVTLKIDRSFVQNLTEGSGFRTIILAVVQMAHSLNLRVIAEGVETEEQFGILNDLGCDFFQGYLLARPLPADSIAHTLAANRADLSFRTEA